MCDVEDVYDESSEGEEDDEEDGLRFSSDEVSICWARHTTKSRTLSGNEVHFHGHYLPFCPELSYAQC